MTRPETPPDVPADVSPDTPSEPGDLASPPDHDGLKSGFEIIRDSLKTAPAAPGVYRMIDRRGEVLYVGKARNIRKRVTSYAQPARLTMRLAKMVSLTRSMMFVTTHTEVEALLLEANLIKRLRPPFNIILRDDKSFPYILLRADHDWAQITKHRGAQKRRGHYYGPFASAGAVNRTLNTLQRVFLLRSCSDSVFENRSRPCLLYQIKRCSAPCVDRISKPDYAALVADARAFLEGRSTAIQEKLSAAMQAASDALAFETAAAYRDRLKALAHVQHHQGVNAAGLGDADVIAATEKAGQTAIQVFFYRSGQNWGNRAYFPRHDKAETLADVLAAFIGQFYDNKPPPRSLLVNLLPTKHHLLAEALSLKADRKVTIARPQRGEKRALIEAAERNAIEALDRRLAESSSQAKLLGQLADVFDLDGPPRRIEVYDNSHIAGANAVGAMVVAGPDGFEKGQYRKFNIKTRELAPGDDYAMMREVMTRRFSRLMREDADRAGGHWPDLVLIDGGRGQLNAVLEVTGELGVEDVALVAVSKGPDRNAGREHFHLPGGREFSLKPGNPVLYYLQRLRDEAHRFAIGSHRARRKKTAVQSPLDGIAGIGAKRKKALLHRFGSARGVAQAGVKDLEAVDGISRTMAQAIYDHFHESG